MINNHNTYNHNKMIMITPHTIITTIIRMIMLITRRRTMPMGNTNNNNLSSYCGATTQHPVHY